MSQLDPGRDRGLKHRDRGSTLAINCPCGHSGRVDASAVGRIAACDHCGNRVWVARPGDPPRIPFSRVRVDLAVTWGVNDDGTPREDVIRDHVFLWGPVLLDREPDNPSHVYAVAASIPVPGEGPRQIGYLPLEAAEAFCDELERGARALARVIQKDVRHSRSGSLVRVEVDFFKEQS